VALFGDIHAIEEMNKESRRNSLRMLPNGMYIMYIMTSRSGDRYGAKILQAQAGFCRQTEWLAKPTEKIPRRRFSKALRPSWYVGSTRSPTALGYKTAR